ncbi:TIGR03621 family F420-dependent LLM class oxidoreductase [Streptomyces sp. TRM66268-LWL]|uniref:TIGR03621 family F420-dependent LLM class oxidoreductase n=1 Tax=Streptomyces polyasparticus TaxID=2767826 RepID=A0ABR7SHB6_9ACTN|nr:TIGR03621 family F420-dependent LLM class oxidoreductase [Streptomyces polyasparticus]MBC9714900.1 TIGR03621 family F420-dependent LLM class oxidoreductase [Streptomyces polyasparticus]
MRRPFRFGVNFLGTAPADAWRAKCRRAEELGYDVLLVPDHLGMPAPFPALVAAAEATERPRLGTFVLNAGFWNPALLAREIVTTDALTGGRLEVGLGTGYVRAEHEDAALPWGSPGERVGHLVRTVRELRRRYAEAPLKEQLTQPGGPPLLIGGNGERVLRLAAEEAATVAFTGARSSPDAPGTLLALSAEEFAARIARYEESERAVGGPPAERNLLLQLVELTDDRAKAVDALAQRSAHLTQEQVLALPILAVGTVDEVTRQLLDQREQFGISYLTVLEPYMEAFAPVIQALHRH